MFLDDFGVVSIEVIHPGSDQHMNSSDSTSTKQVSLSLAVDYAQLTASEENVRSFQRVLIQV